jgi:hypothetical protein
MLTGVVSAWAAAIATKGGFLQYVKEVKGVQSL